LSNKKRKKNLLRRYLCLQELQEGCWMKRRKVSKQRNQRLLMIKMIIHNQSKILKNFQEFLKKTKMMSKTL